VTMMATMGAKNRIASLVDKRPHKTTNTMMNKTETMYIDAASSHAKKGTR